MRPDLPVPNEQAMIFEDTRLYVCLATFPITRGHVVVVWRKHVPDLHMLDDEEYDHLMGVVDRVRDAMLQALRVAKVYLIYMDEARHVHWHLVPRYNEKGFDVFEHEPTKLADFELARRIGEKLQDRLAAASDEPDKR